MPVTVLDIHRALRRRHPAPQWVYFAEQRTHTGFTDGAAHTRYIDGFAMGCWESTKFHRIAYEIKIDRRDWLNELKNPLKRQVAYHLSHEFWFAVAPGVVAPTLAAKATQRYPSPYVSSPDWDGDEAYDLDGCGVLEIQPDGSVRTLKRANHRQAWPLPERFIVSLLRRVDEQAENEETGIAGPMGGQGKPSVTARDMTEPLFRTMEIPR